MKALCDTIKDTYYPPAPIERERSAVRGIVLDDMGRIVLNHIDGADEFGRRDHFETPGGGVEDGESLEAALRREMGEEVGLEIEILAEVGIIANEYFVLRRRDIQHYFLCRAVGRRPAHRTPEEQIMFAPAVWVPADEILRMYDTRPVENVGAEIHARDRIAIAEALRIGKELGLL